MKMTLQTVAKIVTLFLVVVSAAHSEEQQTGSAHFFPQAKSFAEQRIHEFDEIPADRKVQLEELAKYVRERGQKQQSAKLTFICTHNSRRSHMAQIWAVVAADYYGITAVETYSGGTEATAFNPRSVAALERSGLKIQKADTSKNPHYDVRFCQTDKPLVCFSKVYNESPNPKTDYCAVMTCSQADKSCPVVAGALLRVAIPFEDPKVADNTPAEAARYDERCQQISREMLYLFSQVKVNSTK
jgi:arsenate reductase